MLVFFFHDTAPTAIYTLSLLGALPIYSSRSTVDFARLADTLHSMGASAEQVEAARDANTAMTVLEIATKASLPLANRIAAGAREAALATLSGGTEIEVLVYDRRGDQVGYAG